MKLSVVIPAYNEEEFLPRLLSALQNQTYSQPFEIIVADNNSQDNTAEVAKSFGAKVVHEKQQGFAYAANAAFFAADGDILVRSDADSIPPPGWLSEIVKSFENDPELIAVGGPVLPLESTGLVNIIYYPASIIYMYFLRALGRGYLFTNTAVKKEVFYKLKGFRTDIYGEDTDLALRLTKEGKVKINVRMYCYTSIRRVRALGIKDFILKYVIGNEIAKARNQKVTVGLEIVRDVLPYNKNQVEQSPWLNIAVGFLLFVLIFLSTIYFLIRLLL